MDIAEEAFLAQKRGDLDAAERLFSEALRLEQNAADQLPLSKEAEPTRSILYRSAASLAYNSKDYELADRLIARGLSGFPPKEIEEELKNLYEDVNFMRHLSAKGMTLDPGQWVMTIAGNAISYGGAAAEFFMPRVDSISSLFYRTVERLLKVPYRASGGVSKIIKDAFGLYIKALSPSSFGVAFQIGQPDREGWLFPELQQRKLVEPSEIVDEIMRCFETFESDEPEKLKDQFEDETYYENFVGLAKQIAPDGNNVKLVGFTTIRKGRERPLALRKSRKELRERLEEKEVGKDDKDKVKISYTGILMHANTPLTGKFGTVKLKERESKETFIIKVPISLMKDVVQPFYEERVTIHGYEKEGKKFLEEIGLASES